MSDPNRIRLSLQRTGFTLDVDLALPPRGITVQRLISVYVRAANDRGGRRISFGNCA